MPPGGLIDATTVERFRGDLDRLCPGDEPVLFAVSGGADSFAMLALAQAAVPERVRAATVDHGLRPANRAEAGVVAEWCAERDVVHATLTVAERAPAKGRQAWARLHRYDLLARRALAVGASTVATAHHADDHAETFLMRANRGVGLAGLRGIPARGSTVVGDGVHDERSVTVVRPLLGWRRAELASVAADLPAVIDPSNDDPGYERVRIRRLLAATSDLDPAAIARTAGHLAETDREVEAMRQWLWRARRVVPSGVEDPDFHTWLDIGDLPRELQRRLARDAIRQVRSTNGLMPDFDPATNIEPLLDALASGRAATQAGVLATPRGSVWRFREAPPRRTG